MEISVRDCETTYDIVVAGGGPAGCAAAVAAARQGARVLLVESTCALGGMGTSGLVPAWSPYSNGEELVYRGIAQEILERARKAVPFVPEEVLNWVPISAEDLKLLYDDLVIQSGADVLFGTLICGAEREGDRIARLLLANKQGLFALRASVFVDATGDADVAAYAGVPFHKGGDSGELQPATLCFTLSNVDMAAYHAGENLHPANPNSPVYDILRSGKYPIIPDTHLCNNQVGPDTVGFNAGHLWESDGTDPWQVSRSMMRGRKLARAIRDALAEYQPAAFGASHVVQTAPALGTRESRRIVGEYTLTREDYLARRTFPDEIARNCYYLDVHPTEREAASITREETESRTFRYGPGESHGIPFRCLVPTGVDNLLVAGRTISCDRDVMGSVRVMPCCLTTGEAAGVAAAQAASRGVGVHAVDVAQLRETLRACGAYFH